MYAALRIRMPSVDFAWFRYAPIREEIKTGDWGKTIPLGPFFENENRDIIHAVKRITLSERGVVLIEKENSTENIIYSLDIGTRCVKGLIVAKREESIEILSVAVMEHEERAMLDGAIHDVQKVSRIVRVVTDHLQSQSKFPLHSVSVAMAGRFLKTSLGEARLDVSSDHAISSDSVRMLEMNAISESIDKLDVQNHEMYCVGYSVLYYSLDGEWIRNLEGQRGKEASVKVIAAFLPAYIVNAMMNVLEKTTLTPRHITLEPIAAMSLVVPTDLRKLNIALVDVGAGTSDIAISRDGTIIAYGMVPLAGDEISERLCEQYLLDFQTAEQVKREMSKDPLVSEIVVSDILDSSVTINQEEWTKMVMPVLEEITSKITSEILNLNGKPPSAVLIVGGGAKVKGFSELIAEKLGLPQSRVALKMVENLPTVIDPNHLLQGSEYITPVGIANCVGTHTGSVFVRVTVNGVPTDLMAIDGKNTVMQALLQMGYRVEDIIGKPGPAIAFEVNGSLQFVRGTIGRAGKIQVNGEEANTRTRLSHGDIIQFEPGEEGHTPTVFLSSFIDKIPVLVNGSVYEIWPRVFLNDNEVHGDVEVQDKDKIQFSRQVNLQDVLDHLNLQHKEYVSLLMNGMPKAVLWKETECHQILPSQDAIPLNPNSPLVEGSVITTKTREKMPTVRMLLKDFGIRYCTCMVNGKETKIPVTSYQITIDDTPGTLDSTLYEGSNVFIESIEGTAKIVDIFPLMRLDVSNLRGYSLRLNGKNAAFLDPLCEGDEVEIDLQK